MGTCALLRKHKAIDKVAQLWPIHCLRHTARLLYTSAVTSWLPTPCPGSEIVAVYST